MNNQTWVYIQSEKPSDDNDHHSLYTVGFYSHNGTWEPESDHSTRESAAARVHYLNGGEQ